MPLGCDRPGDADDWSRSRPAVRSCERLGFSLDVQLDKRKSAAPVNEIPCAGRALDAFFSSELGHAVRGHVLKRARIDDTSRMKPRKAMMKLNACSMDWKIVLGSLKL